MTYKYSFEIDFPQLKNEWCLLSLVFRRRDNSWPAELPLLHLTNEIRFIMRHAMGIFGLVCLMTVVKSDFCCCFGGVRTLLSRSFLCRVYTPQSLLKMLNECELFHPPSNAHN